jgi:long-chain acyl-CoA synthetase
VAALIGLDPDGLRDWCAERKIRALDPTDALGHPDVRAAVQSAVDDANTLVSQAESIRRFTLLDAGLNVESGHLTPSLKLRRDAVVADFAGEIEKLYQR